MSVRLTRRSLSVASAVRTLEGPRLGGVVVFCGRVRPDPARAGPVRALDYESDRALALRELVRIERTARRRFGAGRLVLWHRLGRVPVGEISVIVGAACGHRVEAFRAARFLIEELKMTVPIWKTERARRGRRRRRRLSRRSAPSRG